MQSSLLVCSVFLLTLYAVKRTEARALSLGIPAEIHAGFFYSIFPITAVSVQDFVPNIAEMQILAAFQMALREINNKTDSIGDDILPESEIKFAAGLSLPTYTQVAGEVLGMMSTAFNGSGVDVAVGAPLDAITQSMATMFQDNNIGQIGYNLGSLMSHNDLYYDYLRTTPCNAYDGKVLADVIVNHFGWTRIVLFYASDDIDSTDTHSEFMDHASTLGLVIVKEISVSVDTIDFTLFIDGMMEYDPRVFILFMPPRNSAAFLEQSRELRLLKTGVTVIGPSYSLNEAMIPFFNETSDVPVLLKGMLVISSNLNWTASTAGVAFLDKFRAQTDTISYAADGSPICSTEMDDAQHLYLYQQHASYNASLPMVCGGLQFKDINASNVNLIAAYAYDATWALARGIDRMLYTYNDTSFDGLRLKTIMIDDISFSGVTGPVSFSKGRTLSSTYGIGDRVEGNAYSILNFDAAMYASTGVAFKTVGTIDSTTGFVLLSQPIIYNSVDNSEPSDSPPSIMTVISPSIKTTVLVLSSLLIIISAAALGYCVYYRRMQQIKSAQPMLLVATLLSCLLAGARAILATESLFDSGVCIASVWFSHVTFYVMLGSIASKMYRLHLVINANGLKKVVVHEVFALYVFLSGLSFVLIYLIAYTSAGTFTADTNFVTAVNGQRTYEVHCHSSLPTMEITLFAIEGVLLLLSVGLLWATSHAPKKVNETSGNLKSKIILGVVAIYVVYALESLSNLDTASIHTALAFMFILCAFTTLTSTMLPKLRSGKKKRYGTSGSYLSGNSGSYSCHLKPDEVLGNILTKYNTIAKEAQIEMCIKHIEVWKVYMAELELRDGVDDIAATGAVRPLIASQSPSQSPFQSPSQSPVASPTNKNFFASSSNISPSNKSAVPFRLVSPSRGPAVSSSALN